MLGVTVDKRMLATAVPCMAAAIASAVWLPHVLWIYTAGNTLAVAAMLLLWWPRFEEL